MQSFQHDFILISAVPECSEKMYRGDRFIFGHPSSASPWNEVCVCSESLQQRKANLELTRTLRGACRVLVLVAGDEGCEKWWKGRNIFSKGESEVDSIGDAVVSKAASSIGTVESTSKTWVVSETKKEEIFPMAFFLSPEAQV